MMSKSEEEIESEGEHLDETINEGNETGEEEGEVNDDSIQSPSDTQKHSFFQKIFGRNDKLCTTYLEGEFENGKCLNPKNMKPIYQVRSRHSTGRNREEQINFYLDYIDDDRNDRKIKTDYDSAQEWIKVNEENDNIQEMKVKGNYVRHYRKKKIFT